MLKLKAIGFIGACLCIPLILVCALGGRFDGCVLFAMGFIFCAGVAIIGEKMEDRS